ncbi:MAG: copper resistance protein CopC [Anaerolineales bacterium]|nr:copper resistance protein CopC [Anaerolineales bacterium]
MRTSRALALGLVGALALTSAGPALAHSGYVRSEPGAGAVIAAPPAQVVIWFEQDMFRRAGENRLEVLGPDGAAVTTGEAVINDDDRRMLSAPLAADLPPGEYTVNWRTLSAEDGDDAEGSFTFTLDPAAAVTSTPMAAPATPTDLPPTAAPAAPTPTPAPAGGLGCGGALAPVFGLAALGLGARRKERRA